MPVVIVIDRSSFAQHERLWLWVPAPVRNCAQGRDDGDLNHDGRTPRHQGRHVGRAHPGGAAERTVGHFVPHMPMVYATPMMILEMEMTSGDAVNAHLEPGWVTLGTEVDIRHIAASAVGATIRTTAQSDRGETPRDPVRGRSVRERRVWRRPPRSRPRQCREFYRRAGGSGGRNSYRSRYTTTVILRSGPSWAASRRMVVCMAILRGSPKTCSHLRMTAEKLTLAILAIASLPRQSRGSSVCCMPSAPISTSSAAAVVPPGEVTFWRSVADEASDLRSNSPEPATVSRARRVASSAGSLLPRRRRAPVLRRAGKYRPGRTPTPR